MRRFGHSSMFNFSMSNMLAQKWFMKLFVWKQEGAGYICHVHVLALKPEIIVRRSRPN